MARTRRIAIVGGGPGGLMLARLLQVRGLPVTVYERDADAGERPQGGSLDIHAETGQRAIRLAGLEAEFQRAARPEDQGDRLYDARGILLFDRDGRGDDRPEIDRSALRDILLDSLSPATVLWRSKVDLVAPDGDGFVVTVNGKAASFDVVVGADGAWSKVRPLLSDAQPIYEGVTLVEFGFDSDRDPEVAALTGAGKMFAVGDNRCLITQRNSHGHIRGYAGWRLAEGEAAELSKLSPEELRVHVRMVFSGWAPSLHPIFETGDILAVRPMVALPIGHAWPTRSGITLLGDAAHLMSPFSGEGVNLALADAADLADALCSPNGWEAVAQYEARMTARARLSSEGAKQGLEGAFAPNAVEAMLEHYRERVAVSA